MSLSISTAETRTGPPGWFGKLPTLGDFASRRLDADFVEPWDDWLARGLGAWRAASPSNWLNDYLAAPSWRFVLLPGVVPGRSGRHAWVGVLMPSVDRVGRYFPLTLAQPLDSLPTDAAETELLLRWLQRLDDVAVDALHEDWTIEQLEDALQRTGSWPVAPPSDSGDDGGAAALTAGIDLHAQPAGSSLWLGLDPDGRTTLRVERGLPTGTAFQALLAGTDVARRTPSTPDDCELS